MHFIIFLLLLPLKIVSATADGYCGVYHGEVCKKYVDNTKSVWYNTSGGYENEVITAGLWEELIVTLDEPCSLGILITGKQFCTTASCQKLANKIGFIGDGSMAKAICRSVKRAGLIEYSQVYVSSPFPKNLDSWKELGANVSTENSYVVKEADIIFLAVKPHILCDAIDTISSSPVAKDIKDKLFISILAGVTIQNLENLLKNFKGSRVVRVMPNTPMLIGEGCTVYCPGSNVTEKDLKLVNSILEVTGMCQMVPESTINSIGAVTGSGPAFVYVFIEALSDGGVRMGLHRDVSTKFAAQTVMGAAKMVLQTNKHMGTLKDEVCSAGGQTIAGIHALEKCALRGSIMDAVQAAALRAAELGEQTKK